MHEIIIRVRLDDHSMSSLRAVCVVWWKCVSRLVCLGLAGVCRLKSGLAIPCLSR